MKRVAVPVIALVVAGFAVSDSHAAPPDKTSGPALEPVGVCSPVYNPTNAYTVPSDRVLVIEDASLGASLDAGELMIGVIATSTDGVEVEHYVGKIDGDVFRFDRDGRSMTVYADPGTNVIIKAARRNSPESMEICFSGRLEPLP